MKAEKVKYWGVFFTGIAVTGGGVRLGADTTAPVILVISTLLLIMWVLGHIIWYRPPE
jgi:hypothetical protein